MFDLLLDFFNKDFASVFLLLSEENSIYVSILQFLSPVFELLSYIPLPAILLSAYFLSVLYVEYRGLSNFKYSELSNKNPFVVAFVIWFTAMAIFTATPVNVVKINEVAENTEELVVVERIEYTPMAIAIPLTIVNKYVYGVNYTIDPAVTKGSSYPRYDADKGDHHFHLASLVDGKSDTPFKPASITIDDKELIRKFIANLSLQTVLQSVEKTHFADPNLISMVYAISSEAQYYRSLGHVSQKLNKIIKIDNAEVGLDTIHKLYLEYFKLHPLNKEIFTEEFLSDVNALSKIAPDKGLTEDLVVDDTHELHGAPLMAGHSRALLEHVKENNMFSGNLYLPSITKIQSSLNKEQKTEVCEAIASGSFTKDYWDQQHKIEVKIPLTANTLKNMADEYTGICTTYDADFTTEFANVLDPQVDAYNQQIKGLISDIQSFEEGSSNPLKRIKVKTIDEFVAHKDVESKNIYNEMFLLSTASDINPQEENDQYLPSPPADTTSASTYDEETARAILNPLLRYPVKALNPEIYKDTSKLSGVNKFFDSIGTHQTNIEIPSSLHADASNYGLFITSNKSKGLVNSSSTKTGKYSYLSNLSNSGIEHMLYSNALQRLIKKSPVETLVRATELSKTTGTDLLYKRIVNDAYQNKTTLDYAPEGIKNSDDAITFAIIEDVLRYLEEQIVADESAELKDKQPSYIRERQEIQYAILFAKRRDLQLLGQYKELSGSSDIPTLAKALSLYRVNNDALGVRYMLGLGYGRENIEEQERLSFFGIIDSGNIPWMSMLSPSTTKLSAYIMAEEAPQNPSIHFDLHSFTLDEKKRILNFLKIEFTDETIDQRLNNLRDQALKESNVFSLSRIFTDYDNLELSDVAPTFHNSFTDLSIIKAVKRYSNDIQLALVDFIGTGSFPTPESMTNIDPSFSETTPEMYANANTDAYFSYISTVKSPQKELLPVSSLNRKVDEEGISDDTKKKRFKNFALFSTYRKQFIYSDLVPLTESIHPDMNSEYITFDSSAFLGSLQVLMDESVINELEADRGSDPLTYADVHEISNKAGGIWAKNINFYPEKVSPFFDLYLRTDGMEAVVEDAQVDLAIDAGTLVATGGVIGAIGKGTLKLYRFANKAKNMVKTIHQGKILPATKSLSRFWKASKSAKGGANTTAGKSQTLWKKAIDGSMKGGKWTLKQTSKFAAYGITGAALGLLAALFAAAKASAFVIAFIELGVFIVSFYLLFVFLRYFITTKVLPLGFYFLTSTAAVLKSLTMLVYPRAVANINVPKIFEDVIEKGIWSSMKYVLLLTFEILMLTILFNFVFTYIHSNFASAITLQGLESGFLHFYESALNLSIFASMLVIITFFVIYETVIDKTFGIKQDMKNFKKEMTI